MAVFEYKGLNAAGKTVNGLKEADSPRTLRALLKKDGVFLTDVVGQADAGGKTVKKSKGGAAGIMNQEVVNPSATKSRSQRHRLSSAHRSRSARALWWRLMRFLKDTNC